MNPTLLGKACIQIKIKIDTLKVISGALCEHCTYSIIFCCGQYFLKPHWLPWKIYFLCHHFCWKRSPLGPHFTQKWVLIFTNLGILCIGDQCMMPSITLGYFNLSVGNLNSEKFFVVVNCNFWKPPSSCFSLTIENPSSPMVDCKIASMAMVRC